MQTDCLIKPPDDWRKCFLKNGIIGLLEILEQLFSLIRFSTSGCFFVSNINFSPAKFYWFKTQRKPTLPFPRQLLCSSL